MLTFCLDFEVDAWSRFWRWNLIKICVWTCDMTLRSYFGKMNSTLGSVVPLAMFFSSRTNPLITNWQIYLLPYDRTFEFPWERLLLGRQVESYLWVETLRPSSDFPPQIGAGAFGVVHVAVAVGIRESEDQVLRKPSWLPNSTDLFCSFWCLYLSAVLYDKYQNEK